MAYIYKITNDINNKVYIGKTITTITERWREHISDSKKERCKKRPLYDAMNKYGIEHFHIEEIEKCSADESKEREKYWIQYYRSYHNGYNATLGGDGTQYLDYDLIIATYQQIQNIKQTAELCNCCVDSVHNILCDANIPIKSSGQVNADKNSVSVAALDIKTEKIIKVFSSITNAAIWLEENNYTKKNPYHSSRRHISEVIHEKRKTAYGFKWIMLN